MILVCPLAVYVSTRKMFIVNLNEYRNAHYLTLNKAKIAYLKAMADQIKPLPVYKKCEVVFTMYPASNRAIDTSNVCSIHDKFLMDALVKMGKLKDDDSKHYVRTEYLPGEVDKNNPRVEAEIREVE